MVVYMKKEGILSITERVLDFLKDGEEHTIHSVSYELRIHWNTAVKILEHLKKISLVKEKKGKKTYKHERLFSLKK